MLMRCSLCSSISWFVDRHPHERGCHSGAAASIPAMTAMNVTAMQRKSTGAEKNTNMVASTLLAQIASVKRRPRVLGIGDQNQSPKCGALEPHTRQTPTDNEFHPATGLGALGWALATIRVTIG